MEFFEDFYLKTVRYDITNKFFLKNTKRLPKLTKIILNFNCHNKPLDLYLVASSMLALEFITCQRGVLTKSKFPNLSLRLRKGIPVGCKLTLKKENNYIFLSKILQQVYTKNRFFILLEPNSIKNAFSFNITELLLFNELAEQYKIFRNLNRLNVTIVTNTNSIDELEFVLKALKLPLKVRV